MKIKLVVLSIMLILIILLASFGKEIKTKAINMMSKETPDYYCDGNLCTTCNYQGNKCSCQGDECNCDNFKIPAEECNFSN